MDISLVMFKSDSTRREFPIKRDVFVIGRKNTCDLRIPLSSVSRKHCELKVVGDEVLVKDLGSSNGTFVNRIRVEDTVLKAGDELVVGPVVFTVVVDGKPDTIDPVRSLVEDDDKGGEDSDILPSDMLEEVGEAPASTDDDDTISDIEDLINDSIVSDNDDDDDDPISALDKLSEIDLPDSDLPK